MTNHVHPLGPPFRREDLPMKFLKGEKEKPKGKLYISEQRKCSLGLLVGRNFDRWFEHMGLGPMRDRPRCWYFSRRSRAGTRAPRAHTPCTRSNAGKAASAPWPLASGRPCSWAPAGLPGPGRHTLTRRPPPPGPRRRQRHSCRPSCHARRPSEPAGCGTEVMPPQPPETGLLPARAGPRLRAALRGPAARHSGAWPSPPPPPSRVTSERGIAPPSPAVHDSVSASSLLMYAATALPVQTVD